MKHMNPFFFNGPAVVGKSIAVIISSPTGFGLTEDTVNHMQVLLKKKQFDAMHMGVSTVTVVHRAVK